MAIKDVKKYYLNVQEQYFEMLQDAKDFDEALKGGYITEEQAQQATAMLESLKTNYNRLSYIILLLNAPAKKKKLDKYKKENSDLYNYLAKDNDKTIIDENINALKEFRNFVKGEIK